MTWQEIKVSDKDFLTPADISSFIGCDPQTLRLSFREHPELIGFPCTMIGKYMHIPRLGFIRWVQGGE